MLKALSVWQSLNKSFLLKPLKVVEAQRFVMQMAGILKQADKAMSDEVDNLTYELILTNFFEDLFGEDSTSCRSNLIFQHTEIATLKDQSCRVLGFAVPTDQRISMITRRQINKPIFHKAICSYLFEYFHKNNRDITYLWISNVLEWFLFDTEDIHQWLQQKVTEDETLWEILESHKQEPQKWEDILKRNWKKITTHLPATVFSLYGFQEQLENTDEIENDKLLALQKLLSPTHLLKNSFSPDKTISAIFFKELFYILGVEELERKNGNILKAVQKTPNLFNSFKQTLKEQSQEEELDAVAWHACVDFICRLILHKTSKAYNWQWLKYRTKENTEDSPKNLKELILQLQELPLLGEKSPSLSIDKIDLSFDMRISADTVLKDANKQSLQFQILAAADYLIQWLNAYEIVLDYRPRIQKETIFIHIDEVIHHFQRFSEFNILRPFLSESFLTDLCKRPLREAIIRVFNLQQGWECENFGELEERIEEIPVKKANACMDHLSVCNPALNSGDVFLYCFEEWLRIKMQLGILCDGNGEFLPYYLSYEEGIYNWWLNDEGAFYVPNRDEQESLRLLSAMQHEFEHVFGRVFLGVEESPLAVTVAYTRLYLLYLKFANPIDSENIYFPSLNNNVRHANPLISRFPLDLDIQKALAPTPYGFEDYKYVVQLMKIARSSTEIAEAQHMLKQFKQLFRAHVSSNDRRQKRLEKLEKIFHQEFMTLTLLDFGGQDTSRDEKRQQMETEIQKLKEELRDEASGVWYQEAFEWRLEFPEILDAQGNFVGFDLVICIPPPTRQDQRGTLRHYFKQRYKTYNYQAKLFMYYIELGVNLLKDGGQGVFILPKTWTESQYASSLREWIVNFRLDHYTQLDIPQLRTMSKLMMSNFRKSIELEGGNESFEEWISTDISEVGTIDL